MAGDDGRRPDQWVKPPWYDWRRIVIAPVYRQARNFIEDMRGEWNPDKVRIVTRPDQLRGLDLSKIEVHWLDGLWSRSVAGYMQVSEMETMIEIYGGKVWRTTT